MMKQFQQSNSNTPLTHENGIIKTGRSWRIVYRSMEASVRNRKGLSYLLPLLQNPGASLSVLQISHICKLPGAFVPKIVSVNSICNESDKQTEEVPDTLELIGSVNDQLKQLWDHIELAQARGDRETWLALEDKQQQIFESIARAQDTNGELFELNKRQHNTRSSICQQIRSFIKKDLAPILPGLAEHLNESLNYGLECSYRPVDNTSWVVRKG